MAGLDINPGETSFRKIVDVIRQLVQGKSNATGTFTLTANAATTTVKAPTCSPSSVVLYSPQTANAAAAIATTFYAAGTGQFVLTHANNAQVDKSFGFAVLG
jgi:hypothetical protein